MLDTSVSLCDSGTGFRFIKNIRAAVSLFLCLFSICKVNFYFYALQMS